MNPVWKRHKQVYVLFLSCLQARKVGEMVLAAGLVTVVTFGIVSLAGAIFGGSKKENNRK